MARGSKPGEHRGGRVKGTPNRVKGTVQERLAAMGVDPIEGLARIGKEAEAAGDKLLASNCYKTLSEYCEPKRRAIEYTKKYTPTDPMEVERKIAAMMKEAIAKLPASELIEIMPVNTLKELRTEPARLRDAG